MKLQIDYADHPAFARLVSGRRSLPEATTYFAGIDEIWGSLLAPGSRTGPEAGAEFDRLASPLLRQFKDVLQREPIVEEYRPFVFTALDNSLQAVRTEIVQVVDGHSFRRNRSAPVEGIVTQLRETGAATFRMAPAARKRVSDSLQPYFRQVEAQRDGGSGARCFVAVPPRGTHWDLLKAFVRDSHIEDAISSYAGFPLALNGYALTLSHPGETWFKICYEDLGLPAVRTVQMHYDIDNLTAKAMFYLNEVSPDSGPFSCAPNSKALIGWRSQTSYFKYLDYANNDYAAFRKVPGTIYNRPMFIFPELRPAFASLPAELQGSGGPGDDVLDASPLSAALLRGEHILTSDDGDLMLFAGGEILHRGGVAKLGQRYALQMIFQKPPSLAQKVRGLPRRVGNRIKRLFPN